jgi:dihydroorotase
VLGENSGVHEPRLRIGESATCVLFDPAQEWTVGEKPFFSGGKNTPLMGKKLRGRVLMTLYDGSAVYHDTERLPWDAPSAHD